MKDLVNIPVLILVTQCQYWPAHRAVRMACTKARRELTSRQPRGHPRWGSRLQVSQALVGCVPCLQRGMMSKTQSLPWRTFSLERQSNDRHVSAFMRMERILGQRDWQSCEVGRGKSRVWPGTFWGCVGGGHREAEEMAQGKWGVCGTLGDGGAGQGSCKDCSLPSPCLPPLRRKAVGLAKFWNSSLKKCCGSATQE